MKIIFHSKSFRNKKEHQPTPSKQSIPRWFLEHDKYIRDEEGKIKTSFYKAKDGQEKVSNELTWKSCPAILDSFLYGYYIYTPCELKFKKEKDGYVVYQEDDFMDNVNKKTFSFCGIRGEDKKFPAPYGYSKLHFTWTTNWFPQVPEGYSALVTHPINRFDLPFFTLTGIIDCSEYINGGLLPFFLKEDFEGIIPAGTPYAQIIPLKNEIWESENIFYNEDEMLLHRKYVREKFSIDDPDHTTNYKKLYWKDKNFQ